MRLIHLENNADRAAVHSVRYNRAFACNSNGQDREM